MAFLFFILIAIVSLEPDIEGILVAIMIPGGYSLLIFSELHKIYKTQKIEFVGENIIIEGKIRKDPWEKLGNEIEKRDIHIIGYSYDLYGKEIYNYPIKRAGPSEIAIELKNGRTILFDAYEYTSKQKLYFLKTVTEKGDVLIEGRLKLMMSRKTRSDR